MLVSDCVHADKLSWMQSHVVESHPSSALELMTGSAKTSTLQRTKTKTRASSNQPLIMVFSREKVQLVMIVVDENSRVDTFIDCHTIAEDMYCSLLFVFPSEH